MTVKQAGQRLDDLVGAMNADREWRELRPAGPTGGPHVRHHKIAVALNLDASAARQAHIPTRDPTRWSEDDARAFVLAVWQLMQSNAAESLRLREIQPWVIYALEFVTDRGAAISEPLPLSTRALGWLRAACFVSNPETVH